MPSLRLALCILWFSCAALLAQDWRVVDGPHRLVTGAYDAARGRVVTVASGRETREWDGSHWLHRPVPLLSTLPLCMAYDEGRRVTVALTFDLVFTLPFGLRTWESDGSSWTQRQSAITPPLQPSGSCAYDAARRRIVFVTSNNPGGTFSTLEWDGQNWQTRPTPPALTGRLSVSLAYDAARARTVLFGGLGAGGVFGAPLAETWEWDGTAWLQRTFPVQPSARASAALAYDSGRQVCVLFGGTQVADTWEYDGLAWTQRLGPMPPARTSPALVYDPQRGRTVLFGGRGVPFWNHDVWEWDGTTWSQRFADRQPPYRAYPALAYSATRDRLVMFGGDLGTGVANETWEWDGSGWNLLAPPQSPPGRLSHSMWSDGTDVFVFGGNQSGNTVSQNDTWRFDGSTWHQIAIGPAPAARAGAAVTFEPITAGALLFGGRTGINPGTFFGDTWRLSATGWSQVTVSPAPSPRTAAAIATDPVRGRIVLWGGVGPNGSFDDTWEWDGVAWLQQNPVHRPPAGNELSMAFEPNSGAVVLLTRPGLTAATMETWLWGNGDWVRLATPTQIAANPGIRVVGTPSRVFAHDAEHLYALTAQPPLVGSYGAGCPTATLRLDADTWPQPGANDFALRSSGHAANAAAVFVVGTAAGAIPIGPCTLLVQPGGPLVGAVADGVGICSLPVPLQPVPALVGLRAFAQVWSFGANGLAATNGQDLTIGI